MNENQNYHAIKNSLGGYDIIHEEGYNDQGDIIATGMLEVCQDAIEADKKKNDVTIEPAFGTTRKFIRHAVSTVDQVRINKNMQRASRLPKVAQIGLAAKFLLETRGLINEVADFREKRNYQSLQDDDDFQKAWDGIEAAGHANDALTTLRLAMAENMRLSHEVNCHRRALGKPLMKVYQA